MSQDLTKRFLNKIEEQENSLSGKIALVDSPSLGIVWLQAVPLGDYNINDVTDDELETYIDLKCAGMIADGAWVEIGPHHVGSMIVVPAQEM